MKEPLWWYNYIRRHWQNWRLKRMWIAEGRDPLRFPRAGKITPEFIKWAEKVMENDG